VTSGPRKHDEHEYVRINTLAPMVNKTITLPEDVIPIIEGLGQPFSRWVTNQLRKHGSDGSLPFGFNFDPSVHRSVAHGHSEMTFGEQLLADAVLADESPTPNQLTAIGQRMGRSASY
jgi:hypothetical protein